jgi:ABC-type transporter Mla subunit MlaD
MAFKITQADDKRIRAALDGLAEKRGALEDAVRVFNDALAPLRADLHAAIDSHDEAVQDLRGLLEDIHREADDAFDGRTDNWKASDKGEAVCQWLNELETLVDNINDADRTSVPADLDDLTILPDDPADAYEKLDKEPQ